MTAKQRCQALTFDGRTSAKRCRCKAAFRHRHTRGSPDWKIVHFTSLCRKHSVALDELDAEIARRGRLSTEEQWPPAKPPSSP
jgi:hypothetical protein